MHYLDESIRKLKELQLKMANDKDTDDILQTLIEKEDYDNSYLDICKDVLLKRIKN